MKERDEELERLVDAAFGNGQGEGANPGLLGQFRRMAEGLKAGFFDAPSDSVQRAKAVFPPKGRISLGALLVSSSFATSGARLAVGDEAQVVLAVGEHRVRLMYGRQPEGWEIVGELEPGWTVAGGGQTVPCDEEGRFALSLGDQADSSLTFTSDNREFHVPPLEELAKLAERVDQ